jgi:hypothetical protein
VTTEVGVTTERLRSVQIRKRALSGRSKEASERQFAAKKAERFVGNLEAALDLHRRLGSDSGLVEEVSPQRSHPVARQRHLLLFDQLGDEVAGHC